MRFFICLGFFIGFFYHGISQQQQSLGHCKIKGRIIDSTTKKPVDYATVAVFLSGSTTVAGGMITDDNGQFTIDNLAPGEYYAKIDFIGYNTKTQTNITVSDEHATVNLGDIKIAANSKNLKEVTVTGNRSFMENKLDKFVYNVEKDVTSQGGVATDVLRKLPQVSVDVDGNVDLLGSTNIRVFINGKPSTMFDNNLAEALAAIPASQIKSIEVITSPGAQYDAQGTGGIINIILKDNKAEGINGSVAVSAGTLLENGSANIHAKKGSLDINASMGSNAQLKGTTLNSLDRVTTNSDGSIDSTRLRQNGNGTLKKDGYRGQLGFDWAVTKKSNITGAVSYNNFGNENNAFTNQTQIGYYPLTDTSIVRNANTTFRYKTIDWNINYIKKFSKEGQELDLSFQSSYGRGNTHYTQNQRYDSINNNSFYDAAQGNNNLKDNETYVIADYAHPLSEKVILNVGVKGSFTRINSYSDNYGADSPSAAFTLNQLNDFIFKRDVYAAYASLTFPLSDDYSVKAGMRDEYTQINIPGDSVQITPSYNSFIPSIIISRKLDHNQTIKITYYRRIQRAGYKELNPFIDATDPTSLVQGNPYLKPERTNAGELSYFKFFDKGGSILITLYYRNTQDDEQNYVLHYDSLQAGYKTYYNVTVATNENAGTQQMTGLNISGTVPLSKKLEVRGNIQVFNKYIVSDLIPGNTYSSFNYRTNVNASYQFSKTLIAEVFGYFNSPRTEIQGKFPSFTTYSFAARKLLFDKKASIGFSTSNPFNKYVNQPTSVNGQNFILNSNRKIPYQSFGLTFTYKFGKIEYKEKKPEKDPNMPDEGG